MTKEMKATKCRDMENLTVEAFLNLIKSSCFHGGDM